MKSKRIYIAALLLSLGSVVLTGCGKEYLETAPSNATSNLAIPKDPILVEGMMEGVHHMMYTYDFGDQAFGSGAPAVNIAIDFMSDDQVNSIPAFHVVEYLFIASRDVSPHGDTFPFRVWDFYYTLIQHCNASLVYTEEALKQGTILKAHGLAIRAQAKAVRAYCYHILTQCFGKRYEKGGDNSSLGVILRLEEKYEKQARNTVEECYAQINSDIQGAIADQIEALTSMQADNDIEGIGKFEFRRNWISLPVMYGIAARVALTQEEYDKAAEYAQHAIDNSHSALQVGEALLDGFNNYEAAEWMWGYSQATDQNLFYSGFGSVYSANFEGHNRSLRFAINRSLYNKMGAQDVRRKWFICKDLGDAIPSYGAEGYFKITEGKDGWETSGQCVKFLTKAPNATFMDNVMMRLGEMYYIIAECKARKSDEGAAKTALETVMKTRDEMYSAAAFAGPDLLEEIIRNKRIDLYWEGIAFFEMKRLKRIPDRLSCENTSAAGFNVQNFTARNTGKRIENIPTTVDDKNWEFVIPGKEFEGNDLCVQNPL